MTYSTHHLRWAGILLLAGVIIFSGATIAAEPFEQETAVELYEAIAQHTVPYQWVNLFAAVGFIVLLVGFVGLTRLMRDTNQRLTIVGLVLLSAATVLWIIEVVARVTTTVSIAQQVARGSAAPPTAFPDTIGVGLEPLFLAFLGAALAGIAVLIWSVGKVGLLSRRLTLIGVMLVVASGSIAAVTYPWVGGVERILFYPLLVVFSMAIMLLVRGRWRSPTKSS